MSNIRARQLLSNKSITIPTLPAVVQKVQTLLENPNTGAKELGDVVASDAPLAAKVLKIANSAYYGLRERCIAPQHASAVLGVRVLRNVVTQAAVISKYDHLKGSGFDLTALWKHSILVAQACNFLGKRCRATIGLSGDELYVCGLLHDLGQVVLLDCLRADYLAVVDYAREKNLRCTRPRPRSSASDTRTSGTSSRSSGACPRRSGTRSSTTTGAPRSSRPTPSWRSWRA